MNELNIYENAEFGQIRTAIINDEPYFCMVDICKSLDIKNISDVKTRLNQDGVVTTEVVDSLGRKNKANFINESNMYKLIFQSRKESAERFTEWVTSQVLPSIRKTGTYQKPLTALQRLQLTQEAVEEVNEYAKSIDDDLQEFKKDMPLLAIECDRITTAVRTKGVRCLGGKDSNAYKDKSLRGKVYSDIHRELKRQFGVTSYKAIKRSQCDAAIEIVDRYITPIILDSEINTFNAQLNLETA